MIDNLTNREITMRLRNPNAKTQAQIARKLAEQERAKPRKYRNVPVVVDGQRFDSKLEARVYARLCAQYGKRNVIRQVSIPIGDKRIRPDFMVIVNDAWAFAPTDSTQKPLIVRFIDAKGLDKKTGKPRTTEAWKAKANHLKDKHGIEIELITK